MIRVFYLVGLAISVVAILAPATPLPLAIFAVFVAGVCACGILMDD